MTRKLNRVSWLVRIFVCGLFVTGSVVQAAWNQYDSTTRNYLDTGNWVDGLIDDVFSSSATTWGQTIEVTADYTLANGLSITRNPSSSPAGNIVFRGDGTDRTFSLAGDVYAKGNWSNTKVLQFGSSTAGQRLILDLGDSDTH